MGMCACGVSGAPRDSDVEQLTEWPPTERSARYGVGGGVAGLSRLQGCEARLAMGPGPVYTSQCQCLRLSVSSVGLAVCTG